jgi:hypothetical protein
MSRYYLTYNEYLGSQRCCDLRGQGPPGVQGPAGPASIGPVGNTGPTGPPATSMTIFEASFSISEASYSSPTLTIPPQSVSIAYYNVSLSAGDIISQVSTTISNGCTAIVYINGPTSGTATIGGTNGSITNINYRNLYTNTILQYGSGNTQNAILQITNINGIIYGELIPMYNN